MSEPNHDALRDEILRLREALVEIADWHKPDGVTWFATAMHLRSAARNALDFDRRLDRRRRS